MVVARNRYFPARRESAYVKEALSLGWGLPDKRAIKRVIKSISIRIFVLFVLLGGSISFAVDAFPGAEGSGRFTTGGRGGNVYEVTNLGTSGTGSIVDAVSQPNRTIVFRVSGTIELGDSIILRPKSNTTIAGQTAPGDGICIKGRIEVKDVNVIIRYIRVRVNNGGPNAAGDAVNMVGCTNVVIDHVTASYARDEGISCEETADKVTVQWCIISESITDQNHSYGSLIRGDYGDTKTYHHNLYAHNQSRNPRPGNYTGIATDPEGLHFDFRNNVVYNWSGSYPGYNDDHGGFVSRYNFIGNDCIRGPESSSTYIFRESAPDAYGYFHDNAFNDVVPPGSNPWVLILFNPDYFTSAQIAAYKARSYLIPMEAVTTTSPAQAKIDVLAGTGASYPTRDIIDTRIVNDVINKTGHSIPDTNSQPEGGWPALNSLPALADSDHDGMPDIWETSHGLNPNDSGDRNGHDLDPNYTNLEVHLDWLVSSVRTDIVYDGIVNFYDFAKFAGSWNASPGNPLYDKRYDFSHDGMISVDDLSYITEDWLTGGGEY